MAQDDGKEVQTIRGLCILEKLIASGLSHGLKLLLSCRQLPCQPWLAAAVCLQPACVSVFAAEVSPSSCVVWDGRQWLGGLRQALSQLGSARALSSGNSHLSEPRAGLRPNKTPALLVWKVVIISTGVTAKRLRRVCPLGAWMAMSSLVLLQNSARQEGWGGWVQSFSVAQRSPGGKKNCFLSLKFN